MLSWETRISSLPTAEELGLFFIFYHKTSQNTSLFLLSVRHLPYMQLEPNMMVPHAWYEHDVQFFVRILPSYFTRIMQLCNLLTVICEFWEIKTISITSCSRTELQILRMVRFCPKKSALLNKRATLWGSACANRWWRQCVALSFFPIIPRFEQKEF